MSVFGSYANFYDMLYRDKNYPAEVEYIIEIFEKYKTNRIEKILDIGCGTGGHAFIMAERGYTVTGLDISETMLEIANEKLKANKNLKDKLEFLNCDARNFRIGKQFDAVVSLFHVISYQITNEDLISTFKSIYSHLKPGGIFIFDFWYGPAVLTKKPEIRLKTFENDQIKAYRIANPVLHCNENIVDVNYSILIQNKLTKAIEEINETHNMRYLFIPEIKLFLESTGFKIVNFFEYLTNKTPGFDSWNVCIVGKK